jgi:hypothetical protein
MDISSVSPYDYICLAAHLYCLINNEKDPTEELKARGYSEAQIASMQTHRPVKEVRIQGLLFKRPLTDLEYPLMGYALTLLENYERGNLPFPGAISEQPAQIIEILNLLQAIKLDIKSRQEQQYLAQMSRR